jgi:hypothetical protein
VATEELDALLDRMPKIAEAVNSFSSEAVQQEAFHALVSAFSGKHIRHAVSPSASIAEGAEQAPEPPPASDGRESDNKASTTNGKKKKSSGSKGVSWTFVKGLDLNPVGKESFRDYLEKKSPKSDQDLYPVIVHYLLDVGEVVGQVSLNEIGSTIRLAGLKEPTNLASGVGNASTRKGTLDLSSYTDIKLTPKGRNFVLHELPQKKNK